MKVFDTFKGGSKNLTFIRNSIELVKGDFFSENDVTSALKDVDYVFHYISTTNPATAVKDPVFDIQSNMIGSVKMFQSAQKAGVKKMFFSVNLFSLMLMEMTLKMGSNIHRKLQLI